MSEIFRKLRVHKKERNKERRKERKNKEKRKKERKKERKKIYIIFILYTETTSSDQCYTQINWQLTRLTSV